MMRPIKKGKYTNTKPHYWWFYLFHKYISIFFNNFFSDNSQYDLLVIFNNVQEYLLFILVALSFFYLDFLMINMI